MIHFNFIVSDAEAENIMEIMHDRINHNNLRIFELIGEPEMYKESIAAYRQDNEYVKYLIKKMTNARVEE